MIEIQLNGQIRKFETSLSIEQLLNKLSINKKKVAVELNKSVVPKQKYSSIKIANQDVVEIVTFIGGG
ncbi:MAG: sulfur carrier protein ThiS [Proteobacteria bacterium]|jgi:sulfur carrier protein|nr:sulfur carrier protein ThiS [Pseudomonadota bacterium]MDA0971358.1 sulfur carrier protein ThiS [Pseudomonadota bacterium]MDA0995466.1 sulfur carrier protein ThiS [Pseudomonadota bacterium]